MEEQTTETMLTITDSLVESGALEQISQFFGPVGVAVVSGGVLVYVAWRKRSKGKTEEIKTPIEE